MCTWNYVGNFIGAEYKNSHYQNLEIYFSYQLNSMHTN
jgi:hypothetical protein